MYYSGCADGIYNEDGTCSIAFVSREGALRHCDSYKTCKGVANDGPLFTAVAKVSFTKRKFII